MLFYSVSRTIGASFRLFLAITVLKIFVFDALHLHFVLNALFTVLLIWAFTTRGGVRTLVFTDALQTTFLIGGLLMVIYTIAQSLGVGLGGLVQTITDSEYSKVIFTNPLSKSAFGQKGLGACLLPLP